MGCIKITFKIYKAFLLQFSGNNIYGSPQPTTSELGRQDTVVIQQDILPSHKVRRLPKILALSNFNIPILANIKLITKSAFQRFLQENFFLTNCLFKESFSKEKTKKKKAREKR